MTSKLPLTEEIDFHYLLGLMPPLHNVKEFAWLPELFSIIGHERLILLCKYAGGETIQIPTVEELSDSIDALQWFYDIQINCCRSEEEIPARLYPMYCRIMEVYNAGNS